VLEQFPNGFGLTDVNVKGGPRQADRKNLMPFLQDFEDGCTDRSRSPNKKNTHQSRLIESDGTSDELEQAVGLGREGNSSTK
jgi:hypothetical protein